ncbi:T9SS type A sorting domain-containing protein [Adhaeribacter terreus]|uniref:T9SS type A sorting domain-containing protein n=1 Tax=Adhaeribacter terreus TaxID=529703 RepID=A0ABW0E9C2_9BACT
MKKTLLTAFVAAFAIKAVAQQTYTQIALTGYNADIIANGPGSAMNSTNNDADNVNVFAAQNFVNPSNQTPAANTALPNTGLITSAVSSTPGLTFQLAPYTGNNVLRVAGNSSGTVTLVTPLSTTDLYILLTPVIYQVSIPTTFTVNFTDGTSQVFPVTLTNNWYAGAGAAWSGTTRVNRSTSVLDVQTQGPRMFQQKLTMSAANATKSIQSILVANGSAASTNNMLHIMAVTALTPASTLATDAGITAISAPNSGCALTNAETITVTVKNHGTTAQSNIPVSYKIGATGTPVNEIIAGPIAANTSVNYSFITKANLSALGTYSIEARTNLTGDLAPTNDVLTRSVVLSAAPAVPTISTTGPASFCTGGTVTLTAASTTTGTTYQWFKNGTEISGATNATYSANATGSYTVVASLNGCTSAASAAVTVTSNTPPPAPGINLTGTAAICSGDSAILTANSAVTGATFTWFNNGNLIQGATSANLIIKAAGSYTAVATANGCASPASVARVITIKQRPVAPIISKNGNLLTSSIATGNQWYKNGTAIPGAVAPTLNVSSNGAYTAKVTANGCASLASNTITIANTGINDEQNNLQVAVYPNPSNGLFTLNLQKGHTYTFVITDLTGKVIEQKTVKTKTAQLDLSKAAKGIYLLNITSEYKTATRKLFVE